MRFDGAVTDAVWEQYQSTEDHFRATFPTTPRFGKSHVGTGPTGSIEILSYYVGRGPKSLAVLVLPPDTPSRDDLLAGLADPTSGQAKGEVVSSTATTFAGHKAAEIVTRDHGVVTKMMYIWANYLLYVVAVSGKGDPPDGYDRLLKSFQITAEVPALPVSDEPTVGFGTK